MKTTKVFSVLSLSVAVFMMTACQSNHSTKKADMSPDKVEQKTKFKNISLSSNKLLAKENTMSVLWYQNSAEAKALYLQGYNVAKMKLDDWLQKPSEKPYSIILDLDETVLDNSPYQAKNIKDGSSFTPESWDKWVQKKSAKAVAGAKEFLKYANEKGIKIYYVSDRTDAQVDATKENLEKEGIPVQGKDHLLFLKKVMKSKESRRQAVQKDTNLIMLFGDNLVDFADFSKSSSTDREQLLTKLQSEFGSKFIVFPNPMYGSWESAIYQGKHLDVQKQLKERQKMLHSYD
ncbi:TPA: 5'-nucleotidase, lipoprotein e(P4) family [Streptococcus agalactiae]